MTTGRLAFSRPAAQQPPKTATWTLATGETFTFPWRDFITVPPPGALGDDEHHGWYILGFDLSQAELRAMAGEAQEPALLEAYRRGEDVHRLTGSKMLGVPFEEVTDEQERSGRRCNLALQYQLSAPSLAERLGVPKDEGQRLYDAWFAAYPRVKAWTEATVARARKDGYTMPGSAVSTRSGSSRRSASSARRRASSASGPPGSPGARAATVLAPRSPRGSSRMASGWPVMPQFRVRPLGMR